MSIPHNTKLLIQAAESGDAVEVQRLIPISNPKANDSQALQCAAFDGHIKCVKLLIPVSDPKTHNSAALQMAARNGHTQCVQLLIPVSDPKTRNSAALQMATRNGHTQCVEFLYPVSEPMVALQRLQQTYPDNYKKWEKLQEMVAAEHLRNTLNSQIEMTTAVKVQRKM